MKTRFVHITKYQVDFFFERFSNTVIFGMYVNYLFKQAKHKGISDVEIPQKWVFIDFILLCNDRKVARPQEYICALTLVKSLFIFSDCQLLLFLRTENFTNC